MVYTQTNAATIRAVIHNVDETLSTLTAESQQDEPLPDDTILRYCGIEKSFYYSAKADDRCICGFRIGH